MRPATKVRIRQQMILLLLALGVRAIPLLGVAAQQVTVHPDLLV